MAQDAGPGLAVADVGMPGMLVYRGRISKPRGPVRVGNLLIAVITNSLRHQSCAQPSRHVTGACARGTRQHGQAASRWDLIQQLHSAGVQGMIELNKKG